MAYNSIQEVLNAIINAVYGVDVRQAIHDGIDMCYTNASTGETIAQNAAASATSAATNATDKANLAEAWAVGTIDGTDISSDHPAYNKDAKTSATTALANALLAEKWAVGTQNGTAIDLTDPVYHKDAKYSAQLARDAADEASAAANTANTKANLANTKANLANTQAERVQTILGNAESALQGTTWSTFADFVTYLVSAMADVSNAAMYAGNARDAAADAYDATNLAEAWAVGTINDVPIPNTHPAYGKDAKTSADLATEAAGDAADATERIEAIIGASAESESALDQVEAIIRNDTTTSITIPAGANADLATLILYALEKVRLGQSAVDAVDTFMEQTEDLASDAYEAASSANNAANTANVMIAQLEEHLGSLETLEENMKTETGKATDAATAAKKLAELVVMSDEITNDDPSSATLDTTSSPYTLTFRIRPGAQGPGYTIKGAHYETIEDLEAATSTLDPAVGDMYNVGSVAPYDVYRWTGTISGWENQGPIGVSFDKITSNDVDTVWGGTSSSDEDKFLTLAALSRLVINHIKSSLTTIETGLSNKVTKDGDKVLSTNDFTDDLKNRVKSGGTIDINVSANASAIVTLRNNFASQYTIGSNYSVGQYCTYGGVLYRCTTAVTSAPAELESGKWTQISTASEFTTVLGYISTVLANFAGTYTTGSSYSVGDYCVNNRQLYRCTTAVVSAPSQMVSGSWEQVSAGGELKTANTRLDAHKMSIAAAYNPQTTYQQGQYCIYTDDKLYRCKINMSSAAGSPMNVADWDLVNLADDVRAATTGGVLSINGNTGIVTLGASDVQAVSYTATQTLTAAQQKKAWTNLGFPDGSGTAGTTLAVLGYVSAT